jgi:mannose-6-phosphate isomerase-like protein (cupin superfamily)
MSLRKCLPTAAVMSWVCVLVLASVVGTTGAAGKKPPPKVITVDPNATEYTRLLGGPPETVTMRSGLVVLQPGKSVGKHNTEKYEEVLVVLQGVGKMVITNHVELSLKANTMAYCPPYTEHNVTNTGGGPLRYIYIVANTEN